MLHQPRGELFCVDPKSDQKNALHGAGGGFWAPRSPEPWSILIEKTQGFLIKRSGALGAHLARIWRAFGAHLARIWRRWRAGKTQGRPNLIDKTQGFVSKPEGGFGYPP